MAHAPTEEASWGKSQPRQLISSVHYQHEYDEANDDIEGAMSIRLYLTLAYTSVCLLYLAPQVSTHVSSVYRGSESIRVEWTKLDDPALQHYEVSSLYKLLQVYRTVHQSM